MSRDKQGDSRRRGKVSARRDHLSVFRFLLFVNVSYSSSSSEAMSFETGVFESGGACRVWDYLGSGKVTTGCLAQRLAHRFNGELSMLLVMRTADWAAYWAHVETLD